MYVKPVHGAEVIYRLNTWVFQAANAGLLEFPDICKYK